MIDGLKKVDTGKHKVVIKWQLFKEAGDNIPLTHDCFDYAYDYAKKLGYKTTASVFDVNSLKFLLQYIIPFVKISCNNEKYWLIGRVPRNMPVYYSTNNPSEVFPRHSEHLFRLYDAYKLYCVPKYPAEIEDYKLKNMKGVSDHTVDLELFNDNPSCEVFEMHYALEDSTGEDADCGICKTPSMLKNIL